MSTPSSTADATDTADAADAVLIDALLELGCALTLDGDAREAAIVWEGLSELAPALELPWRALAVLAAGQGRWSDVLALSTEALARGESLASRVLRAEALRASGQYAEAARDLKQGLAHDDGPDALRARARTMTMTRR